MTLLQLINRYQGDGGPHGVDGEYSGTKIFGCVGSCCMLECSCLCLQELCLLGLGEHGLGYCCRARL